MGFAIVVGSPGTGIPGGMGANVGLTGFGSLGATSVSIGGWSGNLDTYSINTNPILSYLIGAAAAGTQMSPAQLQFIQSYQVAAPPPVATTPVVAAPPVAPAPPVVVAPAPVVVAPQPVIVPSAPVPIVPVGTPTGSGAVGSGTIVPTINPVPTGLVPGGGQGGVVPVAAAPQPVVIQPPPPIPAPAPQTALQRALQYLEQQILALPNASKVYQPIAQLIDQATNWLVRQQINDYNQLITTLNNFLVNTWPYLAWPFRTSPVPPAPANGGQPSGGHAGYIDPPVGAGVLSGAPTPIFPVNPECSQCKQGAGPIIDEEAF